MTILDYRRKTEQKLIKEFLDTFYEKVGYYPTVVTNTNIETKDGLTILSLNELEEYFEPLLPTIYQKKTSLNSKDRSRSLVELRFIFFFIARTMRYNLKDIGRYCGGRDHTTVIHGLRTFKNLYETDENFRNRYYFIINNIKKAYEPQTLEHFDKMGLES
jgi:chromosomal replication initiator protein